MNRGIYSTATGMIAAQRAMDVTANNLANASTVGYKQDGLTFNDFYTRQLASNGRAIGSLGSGAAAEGEFTNRDQGRLNPTGNPLDLALANPNGMFGVMTPGGTRYTRDGSFSLDAQNRVVDRDGNPLLDVDGREILLNGNGPVTISKAGEVTQDDRLVATVGVWQGRFEKTGDNHFSSPDAQPLAGATIEQGSLEQSNVESIQAMVDMIRFGRFFEMSQKSIQTQDEMTGKVIEVLRS
jgi:flagellar basal body rod protein FlgG